MIRGGTKAHKTDSNRAYLVNCKLVHCRFHSLSLKVMSTNLIYLPVPRVAMHKAGDVQTATRNTWQRETVTLLLLYSSSIYQSAEGSLKLAFSLQPLRKIQQARGELLLQLPSAHQCLRLKMNNYVTNVCCLKPTTMRTYNLIHTPYSVLTYNTSNEQNVRT